MIRRIEFIHGSHGDLEKSRAAATSTQSMLPVEPASRRLQNDFITFTVYRARTSSQNFIPPTASKARFS